MPRGNAQKLLILIAVILVAVLVAVTYHYFESAVHHSINFIWDEWLDTDTRRIIVIPTCFVISYIFFGLQHYLDPKSDIHESKGLGQAPDPTLTNFAKILFIGFFSLVAGASLGPEAILVPACLVIGGYVGTKMFNTNKQVVGLLSMVGFVALFAAFFDSFIAGMLGLLLVTKTVKVKITPPMIVIGAIASEVTVLMLKVLEGSAYTELPSSDWKISLTAAIAVVFIAAGGYAYTYILKAAHDVFEKVHLATAKQSWLIRASLAAGGLSALYLIGGPLVEFTGNQSVQPMLEQAASLGVTGLLWIFVIKTLAIGWSKTLGYRGGLVFPSVFAASVLVSIAQTAFKDLSFTVGLIAAIIGLLIANNKVKILF